MCFVSENVGFLNLTQHDSRGENSNWWVTLDAPNSQEDKQVQEKVGNHVAWSFSMLRRLWRQANVVSLFNSWHIHVCRRSFMTDHNRDRM